MIDTATFLEDLKTYLTDNGFQNIYRDFMPDKPDSATGLYIWAHSVPVYNDGSGTRFIQVQCRDVDGDLAYARAHSIAALLDSGPDEDQIDLTDDRWCIARPRMLPRLLRVDESNRVIYYFEVALWGANDP